jgi:hypothetical protein
MDEVRAKLQPAIDQLPEAWREYWWAIALAAGAVAVLLLWLVVRLVLGPYTRRRPRPATGEEHLRIDLGQFPPAASGGGARRVMVEGVPARVRLVVLAPLGQYALPDDPDGLLDRVLPGLAAAARADGATVRVWPAQVSRAGFAPKFHALVDSPDPPGRPSRWVLAAGPVRTGPSQYSLGLALEADEPCYLGRLTVTPDRWPWLLRIQSS